MSTKSIHKILVSTPLRVLLQDTLIGLREGAQSVSKQYFHFVQNLPTLTCVLDQHTLNS